MTTQGTKLNRSLFALRTRPDTKARGGLKPQMALGEPVAGDVDMLVLSTETYLEVLVQRFPRWSQPTSEIASSLAPYLGRILIDAHGFHIEPHQEQRWWWMSRTSRQPAVGTEMPFVLNLVSTSVLGGEFRSAFRSELDSLEQAFRDRHRQFVKLPIFPVWARWLINEGIHFEVGNLPESCRQTLAAHPSTAIWNF